MRFVRILIAPLLIALTACIAGKGLEIAATPDNPAAGDKDDAPRNFDRDVVEHSRKMLDEGREIFRYDTFGDEAFWGGQLQLHKVIVGQEHGGIGPGITPKQALAIGLKVDIAKLPRILTEAIKGGTVSLDKVNTTVELLRADAVVGVKGFFDKDGRATSIGITCAICHSTVDDSFASGIGRRLDGWPNRDLNVGAIIAMAPNLQPFADAIASDVAAVKKVLMSWGPGRYDAELIHDGKGFRPDGKTAATLLPAAFGMAGVNLHTYNGWGSVTHWNAYVANTQMHGNGTFFDPRMNNKVKYPHAVRNGFWNMRPKGADQITPKLAALHFYQLAIPAPKPDEKTYNADAARRGEAVFGGKARCASCHVPPLFTEPGWSMHTGAEIGIDDFQASRSPDNKFYRTTPLRGLFVRAKGGFYHDGRFPTLDSVVTHYTRVFDLKLSSQERADLVEFLKSL